MKGYGSQRCDTTSMMLSVIHAITKSVWMMMKVQDPIPAATASAMRCPNVILSRCAACQFLS